MNRKYHMYTDEQCGWLKKETLPSIKNLPRVEAFKERFIKTFAESPDWTPVPSALTLLKKAIELQSEGKLFSNEIDNFLTKYLGGTLSEKVLTLIVEYIDLNFSMIFTENEIQNRLEYLTEQAGGSDKPIVEAIPALPAPKKERKKLEKVVKVKKNVYRITIDEHLIWEGENKPSIDLTKSENSKNFYLIVEGEICWTGTKRPSLWICNACYLTKTNNSYLKNKERSHYGY
jgi:hypothetical protein